ncbi:beta-lactamase-like protein [Lasiosphaeris hirsuta]|uniref:Beta-lactamase-like protein n=1 Tax=Lasiosphaeris hirsuta TaxID=260670 RepID=A0AA40A2Y1_9PEZI|nr:beta-lactamase-like protein [Lasiosphaeris hirsuta]
MSTFNGLVTEFPDIRVDFFRNHPDLRPPLACFLSHIHSDHLAGLESLRSPFVYCSAATKEILLRLERFPCRINYAKGILEARLQRYKHLRNLLKPLPLETPAVLELEPGNHIQVTLFNANHCPGAVMFLIEGQGKAILYTGDIRSESWFVNAISRSPSLIEYSSGLKTLDTIYLDTSHIENVSFPTKSEGIGELLAKVAKYPPDTIFHFQAWTYGYEDVWIAMSKLLGAKIHVDEYKMRIYASLLATDPSSRFGTQFHLSPEAAGLVGFMCGNTHHAGCLTLDEKVRLHSCEKGNYCKTVLESPVVRIQPIVTRLPNGQDVADVGFGGGGDDLERDVELDYLLPTEVETLMDVICNIDEVPGELKEHIRQFLLQASASGRKIPLDLERATFGDKNETKIVNAFQAIAKMPRLGRDAKRTYGPKEALPNLVTFPYSRHSSYPELCHLLEALKPRDVWPCTVNPREWFEHDITIKGLFGRYCSGTIFKHDDLMKVYASNARADVGSNDSQDTTISTRSSVPHDWLQSSPKLGRETIPLSGTPNPSISVVDRLGSVSQTQLGITGTGNPNAPIEVDDESMQGQPSFEDPDLVYVLGSQNSDLSQQALEARFNAFRTILENADNNNGDGICLMSTTDNHSEVEQELRGFL